MRERVIEEAEKRLGKNVSAEAWQAVLGGPSHSWPKHWCGAFALLCLRIALGCTWTWRPGVGFLYRLPRASKPEPGDLAYFSRYQHHAIVEAVDGEKVRTIDGNSGGIVRRTERALSDAAAYYSIQPLIDAQKPAGAQQTASQNDATIYPGSELPNVAELKAHILAAIATERGYGPVTEAATRAWQKSVGLVPDGVVGAKTWKMIKG